jgi:predicted DNA-binding transcriptional regulator AlpA
MARPQLPEEERMTPDELAALPAVVNLRTAGAALGLGRDATYAQAKDGTFPVEVMRVGRFLRVRKADLMGYLHLNMDGTPITPPVAGAA